VISKLQPLHQIPHEITKKEEANYTTYQIREQNKKFQKIKANGRLLTSKFKDLRHRHSSKNPER
jgi:hypothetical protein